MFVKNGRKLRTEGGIYIGIVPLKTGGTINGPYYLFIPFTISPGREIEGVDTEGSCKIKILGYDCIIEKILKNIYSVKIYQFKNPEEACRFLPKAFSFLYWLRLEQNIGLTLPHYIYDKLLPKSTDIMESLLDELRLEIKDSFKPNDTIRLQYVGKRVSYALARATLTSITDFKKSEESFNFESPEKVLSQEKLLLAIELYSNYHFDSTDNARLVTLVTVLEALIPDLKVPEITRKAIDTLMKSVKEMRNEYSRTDDEWQDLDLLLNRVAKLKDEAIGNGMKIFISEIIKKHNELGDSEEISNKLPKIYRIRSKLLHQGKFDKNEIKENLDLLSDFVPKLLKALYISSVNH